MLKQAGERNLAALRQRWQLWMNVVEAFARHRGGALWISYEDYHTLHHGLLKMCQVQALAADGETRRSIENLEEIARPWLTPDTLARTDPDILDKLLVRCRQVGQEIGCRKPLRIRQWLVGAGLAAVAASASAYLLLGSGRIARPIDGWMDSIRSMVSHVSGFHVVIACATLLLLSAILLIWRLGRA